MLDLALLRPQIYAVGAAQHAASVGAAEDIDAPLRISTSTDSHAYLYMPARWQTTTSIKCVAVPKRGAGLPASTLVFDHPTGRLAALINAAELTAIRTACVDKLEPSPDARRAGSAVSVLVELDEARRAVATVLVVYGAGAQAEWHISACTLPVELADSAGLIAPLLPSLKLVRIVNRTVERAQRLVDLLRRDSTLSTIDLVPLDAASAERAVDDADVVCLCVSPPSRKLNSQLYTLARACRGPATATRRRARHDHRLVPSNNARARCRGPRPQRTTRASDRRLALSLPVRGQRAAAPARRRIEHRRGRRLRGPSRSADGGARTWRAGCVGL